MRVLFVCLTRVFFLFFFCIFLIVDFFRELVDDLSKEEEKKSSFLFGFVGRDFGEPESSDEDGTSADHYSTQELLNLFRVPWELEKLLAYVFVILLDRLLFVSSVVPLRCAFSTLVAVVKRKLPHKLLFDLCTVAIIVIAAYVIR